MDPFTVAASLIGIATTAYEAYVKIKADSVQAGESTPQQWADHDAKWAATLQGPEWQKDSGK